MLIADFSDVSRPPQGGMTTRGLCATALIALLVLAAPGGGIAQTKPAQPKPPAAAAPQAPAGAMQAPLAVQTQMPDNAKLAIMIHNTVLALNHANLTGNYSVMRDLATPSFQAANSPAQLAESFSDLRKRKIDLSPIVLFQPKLVRQPTIDERGLLRLVGFFDTKPEQVQFELLYAQVAPQQWRLFGLGVQTVQAPAAQAQPTGAPAKKEADAAPTKKK
jgi:hypothetical protein